ncbi:MAG: TatD family hydrolase [Promethearchaeota archaeon]
MNNDQIQLVDVHCHLEWKDFANNLDAVIERAKQNGIIAIITSSVTVSSGIEALEIIEKYKGYVYGTCGFAPSEFTRKNHDKEFSKYLDFIKANVSKFVGIGEIGLDYYWIRDWDLRRYTEERFIKVLQLADKLRMPIVIHCRDAERRAIEIIEEYYSGDKVHMHCFSGAVKLIKRGLKNGWFFSIPTSAITRRNHKILAEIVPLEQMMLETDAPFLSPLKDEKRNESKNIVLTAKFISELKNISIEEVALRTTENAINFYSLNINL